MLDDEMLTIDDLAVYLKLKPQTIYKWAQSGKIPGAKFGKEWRFRRSAIEHWIDSYIPGVDTTKSLVVEKRSVSRKASDGEAKVAVTSAASSSTGSSPTGSPSTASSSNRGAIEDRKDGQGCPPSPLSLTSRTKTIDCAGPAASRDDVLARTAASVEKVTSSRKSTKSPKRDRGPESN